MKCKNWLLLGLVLSLFSFNAYSACGTKSCLDKIEKIYTRANGDTLIATSGDESQLNCVSVSSKYLTLRQSATRYKEIYQLLTIAQAIDTKVTLRIIENTTGCDISYAISYN